VETVPGIQEDAGPDEKPAERPELTQPLIWHKHRRKEYNR